MCALSVATAVAGCATTGAGSAEDVVSQRAQQRWDLLVKGDYTGAYQFISPAGRTLVTSDAYVGGLRRNFWTGAKVGEVKCATAEACETEVWIEYQVQGRKMRTPVREKWIRDRGNWWFLLER